MTDLLESLRAIDLLGAAREALAFIDAADPCFVALVVGLLVLLGNKMAAPFPALHSWGMRLGVAAFLGYAGYSYFTLGGLETQQLLKVAVRGFIAAGLVLAPFWIVLPVLVFIHRRLRLVLAAFLLYCGYAILSAGTLDPNELPAIALRGLLVTGVVLVVAWIVQPAVDFMAGPLLGRGKQHQVWVPAPPPAREPQQVVRRPDPTPEPVLTDADRRRARVRLRAEKLFARYAPELGERFTRSMFDEFVQRYLGNQYPPEDVEEHGRELEALILRHAGHTDEPPPFTDLTELTRWYLAEQNRYAAPDLDEHTRQEKLDALHHRYQKLAEELLDRLAI